jgi:hypothetical protein
MLLTILISTAALAAAQPSAPLASAPLASAPLAHAPLVGASAVLIQPREVRVNLDGRNWACDPAGQCIGRGGGASQPALRECRRFVARFGAVSAFAREGVPLSETDVAQCNTAVR